MSNILNSLKNISSEGINKLKEIRNTHNCGVCHKLINSNTDTDVMYSDSLQGWFHNECLDTLPRCNSCDNASYHLESGICSRCMNSQSIRNYSYKPAPLFHRVNNKKKSVLISESGYSKHELPILHFGVEIEVDRHEDFYEDDYDDNIILTDNNFASLVGIIGRSIKGSNLFYSKSDSSLTEQGVEVVSHPFSWNYWKTFGIDIYDGLFSTLLASGYYSAETKKAGMHIHVSKSAINKTQLHKLLWFVYECPNFINMIAGRDSQEWASTKWSSLLGDYDVSFARRRALVAIIASQKSSNTASRYTAVNMEPSNSIEFRIFNGTLNIMTLSKSIEFIHSLLAYCSQTSFKDIVNKKSEVERIKGYLKFLSNNQSRYSNLCIFLDREMNELSNAKKKQLFGNAKDKVNRQLVLDGGFRSSESRTATSFNLDRKGMII